MKTLLRQLILTCLVLVSIAGFSQSIVKQSMAVLNVDAAGLSQPEAILFMLQLEAEKTNKFEILDKYEVSDVLAKTGVDIENCFGRTCLTSVGNTLKVDKVLSGSFEKFGKKIIITLRLIDVKDGRSENSNAMEFLDLQDEMQKMISISVRGLFGLENDQNEVNLLVNYDAPISSPKTSLQLGGPRMGASFVIGDAAERLQASKSNGGYEMFPVMSQFGYQWETQYLSAGNFQALVEFVAMIGGLESGKVIPSLAFLNGFRNSQTGIEIAFGPVLKVSSLAEGYYDGDDVWHLNYEWNATDGNGNFTPNPYESIELPDSRGTLQFSANLLLAVGKTFKSGYLNIPVNIYVIPNKKGTIIGTSFGFNIDTQSRRK